MVITVKNRATGEVVFELDVNDAGNIHDLFLEHRGTEVEVEGASYSPGFFIKSQKKNEQLLVAPITCDEVKVYT